VTDPIDILLALRSPEGRFIEPGCTPPHRAPGLCITVRTETAFRLPLAALLLAVVAERVHVSDEQGCAIELALHEAVANAVMHGNLAVPNSGRGSAEEYACFCSTLNRCLSDPVVRARRVIINAWWTATCLCFAVSDEGRGFAFRNIVPADDTPHGRGIGLMQELAQTVHWNQRRRRVILAFPMERIAAA
jgi:anti-sigma regulatory factor (Ser/Thr protein kinase)